MLTRLKKFFNKIFNNNDLLEPVYYYPCIYTPVIPQPIITKELGNGMVYVGVKSGLKEREDKQLESDIDEAVKIIWKYGDIL